VTDASVLVLRADRSSAELHPEVGGRLGQLDLGAGPLLRGFQAGLGWSDWGSYPLLPWSNRIPGGHIGLGAIDADVPVNWPDGSAIHGLVASTPWSVAERSDDRARLVTDAAAGPYTVRGEQAYVLQSGRLRLALSVRNLGETTVPVGLGIHPWFRAGSIRVPADSRWPGEPLPVGPPTPVTREEDLRAGAVPGPMDRCYTDLTANEVEVPGLSLRWDGPITQVVVYSGEPGWVAVEPVTMANDGFGLAARAMSGHGVRLLEPAGELRVVYDFVRAGP
jgi:aldose 1-epimerase